MLRRMTVWILLVLMCACTAQAETAGYTLDHGVVNKVQWVSEEAFITSGHDGAYAEYYVTWWKEGKVFRELKYTLGSTQEHLRNLSVLPLPDGSFKAVVPVTTNMQPLEVHNYTVDWTEQGLVNAQEIPLAQAVGDRLLARVPGEAGQLVFQVLDAEGREQYRQSFDLEDIYDGASQTQVGENTFAFQFMSMDDPINDHLLVVVNRDGVLLRKQLGLLASVFGDGNGGWFVYAPQTRKDYDDGLLSHYDAAGQETARKTLRGGETVRRCQAAKYLPDTDTYLLFGAAVANSRKVYDVFTLETDDALNVRSVDVRAIPAEYGDYEPGFSMTPDGVPYVFVTDIAGSFQRPALLLPFASLPGAKDPGITLK